MVQYFDSNKSRLTICICRGTHRMQRSCSVAADLFCKVPFSISGLIMSSYNRLYMSELHRATETSTST